MDQLKKLFASLSLPQKIGLAVVIVLLAAGLPTFTHWQHDRDFKPLFTNMAPEDAAGVVAKLKEGGIEHRLGDNGTSVLVSSEKVDEARLDLAAVGLPKSGRIGFELFDKTNLGVTDFSEKVNYRRALEGELERTIKAIDSIESARVHITFPKDSVFLDSREPAKASVLVKLRAGTALHPQNVIAISNLVGSAVEGLQPEAVSIVDMQGNLLSKRKKAGDGPDGGDALLDYKHQVEKDLSGKVEATLEPLLGEARFRVAVSADCDITTSEQTDETYDPTRSVMATSQKTEDVTSNGQPAGVPGTPSNLPRSTIKGLAPSGSANGAQRRTENLAFETSRSVRQVKIPRGSIKRISAAVLLDQDFVWQGQGVQRKHVLASPAPERIKAIHDIVAGVLGIQADRGDQVVIESLPFEQTLAQEESANAPIAGKTAKTAPEAPFAKLLADRRLLIAAGAAVLLLVVAVLFLARGRKKAAVELVTAGALPPAPSQNANQRTDGAPQIPAAEGAPAPAAAPPPRPSFGKLVIPEIQGAVKQLQGQIQEHVMSDPAFAATILRGWLEED